MILYCTQAVVFSKSPLECSVPHAQAHDYVRIWLCAAQRVQNTGGPTPLPLSPLEELKRDLRPPVLWQPQSSKVKSGNLLHLPERIANLERFTDLSTGKGGTMARVGGQGWDHGKGGRATVGPWQGWDGKGRTMARVGRQRWDHGKGGTARVGDHGKGGRQGCHRY